MNRRQPRDPWDSNLFLQAISVPPAEPVEAPRDEPLQVLSVGLRVTSANRGHIEFDVFTKMSEPGLGARGRCGSLTLRADEFAPFANRLGADLADTSDDMLAALAGIGLATVAVRGLTYLANQENKGESQ